MNEIIIDPEAFVFPDFCFEKEYSDYNFIDSGIFNGDELLLDAFFEILTCYQSEAIARFQMVDTWQFFIPFSVKVHQGYEDGHPINRQLEKLNKSFTLAELRDYFLSVKSTFDVSISMLARMCWIDLAARVCVYAEFDRDIIVIGSDFPVNLQAIKSKKFDVYQHGPLNNAMDPNWLHTYVRHERIIVDLFYNAFDEYANTAAKNFKWGDKQLNVLINKFKTK